MSGSVRAARMSEAGTLDGIATCLGEAEQWNGAADYLDAVAARVGATGRP